MKAPFCNCIKTYKVSKLPGTLFNNCDACFTLQVLLRNILEEKEFIVTNYKIKYFVYEDKVFHDFTL